MSGGGIFKLMLDPNPKRAEKLDDLWKVLDSTPLANPGQMAAFYREELNRVRGTGATRRLKQQLLQRHGSTKFRCLLYGNQGCGKSTEINRILQEIEDKFVPVHISVAKELNSSSFRVFDILLLILFRLVEEVRKRQNDDWLPSFALPDSDWQAVIDYLEANSSMKYSTNKGINGKAIFEFFGLAKGELQYAAGRSQEFVDYRLQRLSLLADRLNAVADAANRYLASRHGQREWVIVIEDMDKQGVSSSAIRQALTEHSELLGRLGLHVILNVPAWIVWSSDATRLPFGDYHFQIPDVPVYEGHHAACVNGREALRAVLEARANPSLFEDEQEIRCIVASGGNVRDLFAIVENAASIAATKDREKIGADDVTLAVTELRSRYETRLGDDPFDKDPVPYADKLQRLMDVYNQKAEPASAHDRCLNELLKAGAVLRFNGDGRYGVHPLVVDLLKKYGRAVTSGGSI